MTLSQISDASQAIAAIAVVTSLVILILQNRQANHLQRDEATRRQMEGNQNILRTLFEVPGMAGIWARGTSNFESLSEDDRIKFSAFVTYTLRIWEALYQEHVRGQLDDSIWRAHGRMLRDVQALSGIERVWIIRKHVFSEAFQHFYEAHAAQGVAMSLYGVDAVKKTQSTEGPA